MAVVAAAAAAAAVVQAWTTACSQAVWVTRSWRTGCNTSSVRALPHENASNRAAGPIPLPPVTMDCSASHLSPPRVPCGRSRAHAERSLVCAVGGGRGQAAQELRGASEARVPEVQGREQAGGVRQGRGPDGGRRCLHLEQCRMPRRVVSAALPRPGRGGRELARGGGGTQRARRHDPMTVTGSSLYPMGGQHHPRTIYRAATRAVQHPAACFPS